MAADLLQQAWPQSSRTQVVVDTDLLLKEVKRNQRNFRAAIFWRDFREVGSAIVILPVWLYLGIKMSLPWTWYLIEPATIWVIVFRLVDQMRHPAEADRLGQPVARRRAGFAGPGRASNLVAAQHLLVVPAAVRTADGGVFCPRGFADLEQLAASRWHHDLLLHARYPRECRGLLPESA